MVFLFFPSLQAVNYMGQGCSPTEAAQKALKKVISFYPNFSGALVAANKRGGYGKYSLN